MRYHIGVLQLSICFCVMITNSKHIKIYAQEACFQLNIWALWKYVKFLLSCQKNGVGRGDNTSMSKQRWTLEMLYIEGERKSASRITKNLAVWLMNLFWIIYPFQYGFVVSMNILDSVLLFKWLWILFDIYIRNQIMVLLDIKKLMNIPISPSFHIVSHGALVSYYESKNMCPTYA